MENKCCHESSHYEPHHAESCCSGHECHSPMHECHCKEDENIGMWFCAFRQAMKEARVEILKGKILKAWNSKLDKSADAVFETMEIKWRAMLTKEKAKADLKERLDKIMSEAKP